MNDQLIGKIYWYCRNAQGGIETRTNTLRRNPHMNDLDGISAVELTIAQLKFDLLKPVRNGDHLGYLFWITWRSKTLMLGTHEAHHLNRERIT